MTTFPPEVQRRIDQHLDSIDAVLASSGMVRSERTAILDDVQGQIRDMLVARVSSTPTIADVEAIFAELDPPEAYRAFDQGSTRAPHTAIPANDAAKPRKRLSFDMLLMIFLGPPLLAAFVIALALDNVILTLIVGIVVFPLSVRMLMYQLRKWRDSDTTTRNSTERPRFGKQ